MPLNITIFNRVTSLMMRSLISACVWLTMLMMCANKAFAMEAETDKGVYKVLHVKTCPNHAAYPMKMELTMRKYNRTDDSVIGWLEFDRDLTEQHSIKVDICQHTNSGCKPFYVLTDSSLCAFLERFGKDNLETMLADYDRSLPLCPLTKGKHEMTKPFVINWNSLPNEGVYGTYDAFVYVLEGSLELGCYLLTIEFKKVEE